MLCGGGLAIGGGGGADPGWVGGGGGGGAGSFVQVHGFFITAKAGENRLRKSCLF